MRTDMLKPGKRPLVSFETGEQYLIEELIGRGEFGGVYRARALHTEERFLAAAGR